LYKSFDVFAKIHIWILQNKRTIYRPPIIHLKAIRSTGQGKHPNNARNAPNSRNDRHLQRQKCSQLPTLTDRCTRSAPARTTDRFQQGSTASQRDHKRRRCGSGESPRGARPDLPGSGGRDGRGRVPGGARLTLMARRPETARYMVAGVCCGVARRGRHRRRGG
jgi:hypothetical protein